MTTGTPAFMPPELALGNRPVDERSDVYALGCVAYWLVTGQLVFESESPMEMVVNHVKTPPVPPSQRTEMSVSPPMDRLILRCLEKEPDRRPQSLQEFCDLLDDCEVEDAWTSKKATAWWQSNLPQIAA